MDSFEWNKVFAAVIASVLLIMVISIVSEGLFETEHKEPAFTIEVASAEGGEAVVEEEGPSFAELMASADPAKGERQFAKCKACHTVDKGGKDGTGPHLYGVVGRAVASVGGFKYSSDLSSHGGTWTLELLNHWLNNPKDVAKGTSMSFAGIRKDGQRADLIAYLNSMSDTPLPLPSVDAVADDAAEAAEDMAAEATSH